MLDILGMFLMLICVLSLGHKKKKKGFQHIVSLQNFVKNADFFLVVAWCD